jgi:hypothetical protein
MRLIAIFFALSLGAPLGAADHEFPAHGCEMPPPGNTAIARDAVVTTATAKFYHDDDSAARKLCPSAISACIRQGYLVKNDRILTYQTYKDFVCVVYPTAKTETSGWVQRSEVKLDAVDLQPPEQKWLGTWRALRSKIVISRDKGGHLQITGDGTGGPRGGNMADFEANAQRKGDRIYFTAEDEASSKFNARLIGDFLVISEDETEIGGQGVMFGGRYVRSAK